jgi:hypothetical protein
VQRDLMVRQISFKISFAYVSSVESDSWIEVMKVMRWR